MTDRLDDMWTQQTGFMRLLQEKRNWPDWPVDITSKPGQKFLDDILFHMMKELFEAGQHLKNNKAHRITEMPEIDRELFKEELCDALHLFIEFCAVAGLSLEEVYEKYMEKGRINDERIRNGY